MTAEISRRNFLKTAAVGTAGIAAVGMVGCSQGSGSSSASTSEGSSSSEKSYKQAPKTIAESEIKEIVSSEYVVVGAGLAGLSTACSLSENGGKVTVVEKGTTFATRGSLIAHFGSLNSSVWKAAGIEHDKFTVFKSWDAQCNSRCKNELVHTFLDRSGEAMDWAINLAEQDYGCTTDLLGAHFAGEDFPEYLGTVMISPSEELSEKAGEMELGKGNALHFCLYDKSIQNGTEYVFSSPAVQLVQEGDAVVGVVCEQDGEYVKYMADKGVILASGDISGDEEMTADYSPLMNRCLASQYIPIGVNTGDGQKMGLWIGAKMQEAPLPPMIHPQGYGMVSGALLCVNPYGKRFMNEYTWTQGRSLAILNEPGNHDYAYCVFDKNFGHQLASTVKYGGGLMWDSVWRVYGDDSESTAYYDRILGMAQDAGCVFEGETLEEAAKAAAADDENFDVETLLAEVERYNGIAQNQQDTDFGKRSELLFEIKEGPFYIEKVGPCKMVCPGGLVINKEGQVLDNEDQAIEGLYAVGNVSGGLYAVDYPLVINGNSHGRCITFGYLLGRQLTGIE